MPRIALSCLARFCVPFGVAALLVAPPASAQQDHVAPPGNSGVSQYFEAVPSAGGNARPGKGGKPTLPAATRRQLEARGEDGRRVSEIADAGAPREKSRSRGKKRRSDERSADGGSALGSATDALLGDADGTGAGIALPVILAASTLLLALAAVRRRRRGGNQTGAE